MLEVSTVTQYMLEKKRKRKKRKYLDQMMTSKKIQKIMLKVSAKRIGEISSSDLKLNPENIASYLLCNLYNFQVVTIP